MNAYSPSDFDIRGTTLFGYNGKAANVTVPAGVTVIASWDFSKKGGLRIV